MAAATSKLHRRRFRRGLAVLICFAITLSVLISAGPASAAGVHHPHPKPKPSPSALLKSNVGNGNEGLLATILARAAQRSCPNGTVGHHGHDDSDQPEPILSRHTGTKPTGNGRKVVAARVAAADAAAEKAAAEKATQASEAASKAEAAQAAAAKAAQLAAVEAAADRAASDAARAVTVGATSIVQPGPAMPPGGIYAIGVLSPILQFVRGPVPNPSPAEPAGEPTEAQSKAPSAKPTPSLTPSEPANAEPRRLDNVTGMSDGFESALVTVFVLIVGLGLVLGGTTRRLARRNR